MGRSEDVFEVYWRVLRHLSSLILLSLNHSSPTEEGVLPFPFLSPHYLNADCGSRNAKWGERVASSFVIYLDSLCGRDADWIDGGSSRRAMNQPNIAFLISDQPRRVGLGFQSLREQPRYPHAEPRPDREGGRDLPRGALDRPASAPVRPSD